MYLKKIHNFYNPAMKFALFVAQIFLYISVLNASCKVWDITIQRNFDIKKYTGVTWYEQKFLPASNIFDQAYYLDHQLVYYLHPDQSTLSLFGNGRNPLDHNECIYYEKELHTSDVPGKWLIDSGTNTQPILYDYWIVGTDYSTYSVVYSCLERNSTGDCSIPSAWIYSRVPEISSVALALAESILDGLCINTLSLNTAWQTKECPVNKDCAIYTTETKRMQNFDIQRFIGKWYVTNILPNTDVPGITQYQNYQHYYAPDSNGTLLTVFTRGTLTDNTDHCVYSQGQLLSQSEDGKFLFRRRLNSTSFLTADFWIMFTDNVYVKYAIAYGCRQTDKAGICTHQDFLLLSRYPTLPEEQRSIVERKIKELCLNSAVVPVNQTYECPETRDCSVASIAQRMVRDFDIEKLKGRWYKYSYLSGTQNETISDYEMELSGAVANSDGMSFSKSIRKRHPNRSNKCIYESLTAVQRRTDSPGKHITTHQTPTGYLNVTSFVMSTDYVSYLVEYTCQKQDEHFKCASPDVVIWCRSKDLALEKLADAIDTVISLCLNYDNFIKVDHFKRCPEPAVLNNSPIISKGNTLMILIMLLMDLR